MSAVGTAYAVIVAAFLAVGLVARIDGGLLAIVQILVGHLALSCLLLVPVAVLGRSRALAIGLAAVLVLFAIRLGGDWVSLPPSAAAAAPSSAGDAALDVATWNLQAEVRTGADAVAMLRDHPADLVALQELTPPVAAAIEADPVLAARYPSRVLEPRVGVLGLGLLSTKPLAGDDYAYPPASLEARLATDRGDIVVITAHPLPGRLRFLPGLAIPIGFHPLERNAELRLLRQHVQELDEQGEDVLLLGDFNTAPTEAAFPDLTAGLHDAHRDVGLGPGWTWRPDAFAFLGTGLLRIDLVLSTSRLMPLSDSIACPPAGDHCVVGASLALPSR